MKVNSEDPNKVISRIAAAIGEPARVRILSCLLDGHARTSTELAVVAEVKPSTTSVHLKRLKTERLVKVVFQGKHHYYSLNGPDVANALEALSLVAGYSQKKFVPNTPTRLVLARTCYDHLAGKLGVSLFSHFAELGWFTKAEGNDCDLSSSGSSGFTNLGVDLIHTRSTRRRFAYECLDWSERKPHLAGALGAALLSVALKMKWVEQDLDSRALEVTSFGHRDLATRFGIKF
jgi:DNA-binding transcriptional ArsR family regulator